MPGGINIHKGIDLLRITRLCKDIFNMFSQYYYLKIFIY
jgi:hypothetical protein